MRIILCGFGVVGQSFAKLLESRSEDLYARYGLKPRIVGVFDRNGSATDPSGLDASRLIDVKKKYGSVNRYSDTENNTSGTEIINNLEAEVLIETTESNYKDAEPGMTHIVDAMKRGMHVISVNKGPLALAFPSLMEIAEYNHVLFRFSGTVGGGTPILDFAKNSISGIEIINDLEAEVLIETTESNYKDAEPGMTHIVNAMKRGMHVISVNKGPLALAFPSLMEIAAYNQVLFRFSGTVGGGTPILDFAKNSLKGERIVSFYGILNGTTNYILTNMANGMSFNDALDDAKQKGYVEADESLDLDGLDAAAKLVILANWIMGMKVVMSDIKRTGIRKIDSADIKRAAEKNSAIKLIASCNKELTVAPKEIPTVDPLCVSGTLNAISFTSEHSGTQTIIGRGAGGIETASSILRDLIDIRNESTKT